jgi:flavin reductase (DIM6/NTAB) family NADH-FMN oxidoreductase RutF
MVSQEGPSQGSKPGQQAAQCISKPNERPMEQLHITEDMLAGMERFHRANLINSLSGAKQAMLVGTCNSQGQTNLALFSSIVHLGADPALLGFIQRPVGVSGDSYRNIISTGVYTLNHVHGGILGQAHFTSARFPADVSEFDKCRLTPFYLDGFAAPFVQESRIAMGMKLVEVVPITHNDTKLVIGRVKHIRLEKACLSEDGNLDMNIVDSIVVSGLETYHRLEQVARMGYAKVERLPDFSS